MIKKKVAVRSKGYSEDQEVTVKVTGKDKDKEICKPQRGRPKSKTLDLPSATITNTTNNDMPRIPSSRVFSVNIEKPPPMYKTNNIIRLKLKMSNISKLERIIGENKGMLDDEKWSDLDLDLERESLDNASENLIAQDYLTSTGTNLNLNLNLNVGLGLEHFIKRKNVQLPVVKQPEPQVNRKDLIINSGIKRVSSEPLQVFSDSWPMTSPYACWYCCHTFDTTPVGIPSMLTNYMFKCYGNFCSYNCAKRYLCPLKDDEDDMVCMQSSNEIYKCDDHGDKLQLLELMYHLETNAEMDDPIKIAPGRLILKMFGGNKSIEEFRKSFRTNTTYHIFKMPLVSMAYHMEECVDTKSETRRKFKNMSLDVAKLEKAYDDIMKEKTRNSRLSIQKTLVKRPDYDSDSKSLILSAAEETV